MSDNRINEVKPREQWGGRLGFVLATAGSAVGLGNVMKFPWMTGANGGGAFLFVYIIVMILVGASMLMCDFLVGRNGKAAAIFSYKKIHKRFGWMGYLGMFAALLAEAYYAVFGGWMMWYIINSFGPLARMSNSEDVSGFFGEFISGPVGPIIGAFVFHAITTFIVAGGIKRGIEKASKIMMPILFIILLILVIRALTMDNVGAGLSYYLKPDFSKVTLAMIAIAVGQVFFSLNVGTTGMVNYGSYLSDEENVPKSTLMIVLTDFCVAFLAGLIIIPSAFAFNIDVGSGPALLFITMPSLFAQLPMAGLWNFLFFVLLLFASLTSSVSILEIFVPNVMELSKNRISRPKAAILGSFICLLLGVPVSYSFGIWSDFSIFGQDFFTLYDNFICIIAFPLIAFCTVILVGYIWGKDNAMKAVSNNGRLQSPFHKLWFMDVKYICPILLGVVIFTGIKGFLGG